METIIGKLVFLGDQGVGKSSTITRYAEDFFKHRVVPTIGAAFFSSQILIKEVIVKLQIWDTAGQERYHSMAPMFYRKANAALIMYDITSRKSFNRMVDWVLELKKKVDTPMVLCIVGNKLDLEELRTVSQDEASHYAMSVGAAYHECSAWNGQGVDAVFEDIAYGLIRLSKTSTESNLDGFNCEDIVQITASCSDLEATDRGVEERVHRTSDSFPRASLVKWSCW